MESPFLKWTGNILQDRSLSDRSHKPNLGKLKKKKRKGKKERKEFQAISNHNDVRLDVNYRKRKERKEKKIWRLSHTNLSNQQITEEIKMDIQFTYKQMKI